MCCKYLPKGSWLYKILGCAPPTPPIPPVPPKPLQKIYSGVYDLMGATGDWRAYLKSVKDNGGCGVRFFVCYSWQGSQPISPYIVVDQYQHDNGMTFPMYDLTLWNPQFWTHLDEVLVCMRELGLTAWVVMEDFCSLKGDSTVKYWNPMYCSVQSLGPTTPGGVWGDPMKQYHRMLYVRTMESVFTTGVNYILEVMNEYDAIDWPDDYMVAWHDWAVGELQTIGIGTARENIIATPGRCAARIVTGGLMYSPHGIGTAAQVGPYIFVPPNKTIYSSDGFWGGQGGCDAKGRCGVGEDEAGEIGKAMKQVGANAFELLPREVYSENNDRANLDRMDPAPLKAMAFAE